MSALLEVRDLQTYYGAIQALKGVSLDVATGEIVALIGRNGAGKSTLLNTISGLLRPRSGTVRLEGRPLEGVTADLIVHRGITQVPEGRKIFGILTVEENLDMGAFLCRDASEVAVRKERAFTLFPRLRERRTQLGGTLSGGEQQMLAIGRALMMAPRLLLMDEPSLGLAPALVRAIFQVIREINAAGTAVLLVEQNARMALRVAQRGYVMDTGRVVLTGAARDLLDDEEVKRAYLG
ncbi:MAG TPA: ABC transporter ATP-binding protein [Actinomycetota bacterium]|nr:ABC transporter ATP-binding protein [Actinomycetota bacterium]